MLNYVRKGKIVRFAQIYDSDKNNKPKIKCYDLEEFIEIPEKGEREVGYGTLSITNDNVVHLWAGKINPEHLDKYKESRELRSKRKISHLKNNLEILTH